MPRAVGEVRRRAPLPAPRGWPWALASIFFSALIWRLAYQARLAGTPFFADLGADARVYWDGSSRILRLDQSQ